MPPRSGTFTDQLLGRGALGSLTVGLSPEKGRLPGISTILSVGRCPPVLAGAVLGLWQRVGSSARSPRCSVGMLGHSRYRQGDMIVFLGVRQGLMEERTLGEQIISPWASFFPSFTQHSL